MLYIYQMWSFLQSTGDSQLPASPTHVSPALLSPATLTAASIATMATSPTHTPATGRTSPISSDITGLAGTHDDSVMSELAASGRSLGMVSALSAAASPASLALSISPVRSPDVSHEPLCETGANADAPPAAGADHSITASFITDRRRSRRMTMAAARVPPPPVPMAAIASTVPRVAVSESRAPAALEYQGSIATTTSSTTTTAATAAARQPCLSSEDRELQAMEQARKEARRLYLRNQRVMAALRSGGGLGHAQPVRHKKPTEAHSPHLATDARAKTAHPIAAAAAAADASGQVRRGPPAARSAMDHGTAAAARPRLTQPVTPLLSTTARTAARRAAQAPPATETVPLAELVHKMQSRAPDRWKYKSRKDNKPELSKPQRRSLTIPVSPSFACTKRAAHRPPPAPTQVETAVPFKARPWHAPPTPVHHASRKPATRAVQPTLSTTSRANSRTKAATPTTAAPAKAVSRGPPGTGKAARGLTQPVSPMLATRKRTRPARPVPTSPMRTFKARPAPTRQPKPAAVATATPAATATTASTPAAPASAAAATVSRGPPGMLRRNPRVLQATQRLPQRVPVADSHAPVSKSSSTSNVMPTQSRVLARAASKRVVEPSPGSGSTGMPADVPAHGI